MTRKDNNTIKNNPNLLKKAKELAYKIKQELEIPDNKSLITTGSNYNRLKIPSVNIEVKNIDVDYLTEENMDKLVEIIVEKIYDD